MIRNNDKIDIIAGEVPCIAFFNKGEMTKVYKKEFILEIEEIIKKSSGEFHLREINCKKITILAKYLLNKGELLSQDFL